LVAPSVVIPPSQRQVASRRMRSVSPAHRSPGVSPPLSEAKSSHKEGQDQTPVHPEPLHRCQRKGDPRHALVEVDPPTHPGTDVGRRLTTRQVRQHPSAVPSEGHGEEEIFP
jgi:hypothetical protein